MQLTPYTRADFDRLMRLFGRYNADAGARALLHPGDVRHLISNILRDRDVERHLWLMPDDTGELAAVVILYRPDEAALNIVVRPGQVVPDQEMAALFTFAEAQALALAAEAGVAVDSIGCEALDGDADRIALLESLGYARGEPQIVMTRRPLTDDLPPVTLPDRFVISAPAGLDEADAIGALHASAFGSSWPPGEYARVMQSHAYEARNELLAVAPDGTLAAFCVIWIDPISRSGLFEPVGCAPTFQRRGLARALLAEGLRRMRAAGCQTALVNHHSGNPASAALYRSVGFQTAGVTAYWRKAVHPAG